MKTKIFTLALIPIIFLLFGLNIYSVYEPINQANRVVSQKDAIINKLKFIRTLQISYQSVKGKYAGKWADLVQFGETGIIPIVQMRDVPIPGKDGQYRTVRDTIGSVSVKDSILNKYPKYKIQEIALIPNMGDRQFSLSATILKLGSNKTPVPAFEVKDIYPIDPNRGAQFNEKGEPYSIVALEKIYTPKLKAYRDSASIYKNIEAAHTTPEKAKNAIKAQNEVIESATKGIAYIERTLKGEPEPVDEKEEKDGKKEPKKVAKKEEPKVLTPEEKAILEKELAENKNKIVIAQKIIEIWGKSVSKEDAQKATKKATELSKFINLYDLRLKMITEQPLRVGSLTEATTSGNWE
jgi:hypothetical protein